MFQLNLFEKNRYIDQFHHHVRDQFEQAGIENHNDVIFDIDSVETFFQNASQQTISKFLDIINFKSQTNEDSAEYALSWVLNASHVGGRQGRCDLILPSGEGVSVKRHNLLEGKKIKFGRVESCDSYKFLLSAWSFYVNFINQPKDISPSRVTKTQLQEVDSKICEEVRSFFESLDFSSRCKSVQSVLLGIEKYSKSLENPSSIVNEIFRESIGKKLNHIILVDVENCKIKVLKNIDSEEFINSFYKNNFLYVAGNELFFSA